MKTCRTLADTFLLPYQFFICLPFCGCFHLGPDRLEQDEIGYSQALGDSQNQQTLLNAVRLRYTSTPSITVAIFGCETV